MLCSAIDDDDVVFVVILDGIKISLYLFVLFELSLDGKLLQFMCL